jgi:hypothetical protein
MKTSFDYLADSGIMFCELCDNMVHTFYCDSCGEDVCSICHDAYPEDYCG